MNSTENEARAVLASASTMAKRPRMTEEEYGQRINEIDQHVTDGLITEDEGKAQRRAITKERGVDIFIAMNEDGDPEVGTTEDEATERLTDNIGGRAMRIVKFVVHMLPPAVEECGDIVIPDAAGNTTTFEVEAE